MNDIVIDVNVKTGFANLRKFDNIIGNQYQNLQNKLKFELNEFIDGIAWLEYQIDGKKNFALMEKYDKGYQIDIKSCLLTSNHVEVDLKITEDETPEGVPIFVSTIVDLRVMKTINAEDEEPEEYPSWFESASKLLNELKETIGNLGEGELTGDYEKMINLPQINGVTLKQNKSFSDLGMNEITNIELDELFKNI